MSCKGLVGHWSGRNKAVSGGHPLLVSFKKGKNATYLELMFSRRQMGFPSGSDGKESACSMGDLGLIPQLARSPGEGHGNPLQYSCLEHPRGQRSLVGYRPWGRKELGMTEQLRTHRGKISASAAYSISVRIYFCMAWTLGQT